MLETVVTKSDFCHLFKKNKKGIFAGKILIGIYLTHFQGLKLSFQSPRKYLVFKILEPSCCKKRQKSPNQETGLGNRGRLKVLNDTNLILND